MRTCCKLFYFCNETRGGGILVLMRLDGGSKSSFCLTSLLICCNLCFYYRYKNVCLVKCNALCTVAFFFKQCPEPNLLKMSRSSLTDCPQHVTVLGWFLLWNRRSWITWTNFMWKQEGIKSNTETKVCSTV